jgi:hypothetical protein
MEVTNSSGRYVLVITAVSISVEEKYPQIEALLLVSSCFSMTIEAHRVDIQ